MWRNSSQSLLHSLVHIHACACRIINHLPFKLNDSICLFKCNWLTIDYLYADAFYSKCIGYGQNPPLIRFQSYSQIVSRNSFQYKCAVIWNFLTRLNLLMLTKMLSRRSQEGIKRYPSIWTRKQPWSLITKKKTFYLFLYEVKLSR